jgi:predicted ATPase
MSRTCECGEPHLRRRIVLTGGPGAGKTAVLELVRQSFCRHVRVLPESAGIVFGGGFPRGDDDVLRRAAQRVIFFVQRELEGVADAGPPAVVICDRGTVDGAAYWPGPDDLWASVGTTRAAELARYDAVIHLRTPSADGGYNHRNHLRIESASEAVAIDERILRAWDGHPRRVVVDAAPDFLTKATRALERLSAELPACCRRCLHEASAPATIAAHLA